MDDHESNTRGMKALRALLEPRDPHAIRRAYARAAGIGGVDLRHVAQVMQHVSTETVRRAYLGRRDRGGDAS